MLRSGDLPCDEDGLSALKATVYQLPACHTCGWSLGIKKDGQLYEGHWYHRDCLKLPPPKKSRLRKALGAAKGALRLVRYYFKHRKDT